MALEDPGSIQANYDFCPTGNEADLGGTNPMTTVGPANPIRQGGLVYDDTKMYVGGGFLADYSGTGTQWPGLRYGGVPSGSPGIIPAHMPNAGAGGEALDYRIGPPTLNDVCSSWSGAGGGIWGAITGFTRHGLNQVINRGVRPYEIQDALQNPTRVVQRAGGIIEYVGRWANVRINQAGQVVTVIRYKVPWAP